MSKHPEDPQPLRRLDLPSLSLESSIQVQRRHERNGTWLARALQENDTSSAARIAARLASDLDKAQDPGHTALLAANLSQATVHHVLFAKGQIRYPVAQLRRNAAQRTKKNLKEAKLLRKLDLLHQRLIEAAQTLAGSSNQPDFELVFVLGRSVTSPREVFVVSLKDALCTPVAGLHSSSDVGADFDAASAFMAPQARASRQRARNKTSGILERKLVHFMVSDKRVESGLGGALSSTKTHVFLLAPRNFECTGWNSRPNQRFNLDSLSKQEQARFCNGKRKVSTLGEDDDASVSSTIGSDDNVTEELVRLSQALSPVKRKVAFRSKLGTPLACLTNSPFETPSTLKATRSRISLGTPTPLSLRDPPLSTPSVILRRSKPPQPGSLLSRNLLRPKTVSTPTGPTRRGGPRCAGLSLDFGPSPSPSSCRNSTLTYFLCDTIINGI